MASFSVKVIGGEQFSVLEPSKMPLGVVLPFDVHCKDQDGTRVLFSKGSVYSVFEKNIVDRNDIACLYVRSFENALLEQFISTKQRTASSFLDDQVQFQRFSMQKANHFTIDKSLLLPGTEINFNLVFINKPAFIPLVMASDSSPSVIREDLSDTPGDVVVNKSDVDLYLRYLNENRHEDDRAGFRITRETARISMAQVLDNPRDEDRIRESVAAAKKMTAFIAADKPEIYSLLLLKSGDMYTYTHSVNTAVLSVALGQSFGLSRDVLERLAVGAILHDIGKSVIPKEIIDRQGRLDHPEYVVLQSHVLAGVRILHAFDFVPPEALAAVLQHHEKLNGRGYPHRSKDKEVGLFARITAIADCYDAMTTPRPFRPAQSSFNALSVISKETGSFDPNLLKLFIQIFLKMR